MRGGPVRLATQQGHRCGAGTVALLRDVNRALGPAREAGRRVRAQRVQCGNYASPITIQKIEDTLKKRLACNCVIMMMHKKQCLVGYDP